MYMYECVNEQMIVWMYLGIYMIVRICINIWNHLYIIYVCFCVCVCVCVYLYNFIHVYVCECIMCVYMYACSCWSMSICLYLYVPIWQCIWVCMFMPNYVWCVKVRFKWVLDSRYLELLSRNAYHNHLIFTRV